MRQRDPQSRDQARELEALERALAGDPVDADMRELEDLVHDIRASAPPMTPGFAARLEQQVADGFPASGEQPARWRRRRPMLLCVGGSLAVAVVALVVVLGNGGPAEQPFASGPAPARRPAPAPLLDSVPADARNAAPDIARAPVPPGGGATIESAPAPARKPASSAAKGRVVVPPPAAARSGGPVTPADAQRKVQRTADLVLRVPTGEVESTADGVIRTVDRFGGIVASSAIGKEDATGGEASFDLRIPTSRLDDALAALSKLGHVAERRQNLVDITSSFTSVEDRLSDARAERRGLLRALGRATTSVRIDSLRARLRIVRSQIARFDGELDALRRRADLSAVSVLVRGGAPKGGGGAASGGGWSPGDAAHDALRVLEVSAGVALIALAVAVPLALLAAMVAVGVRAGRRRRREGALDPA
ncbi:MAG: hypothetical protein QOJ63_2326 [Solirubrobacteraceae bacterium]|jgi:hypothetical protein|nr:hypothetical protein [Solirubrobacteraceae bacterium]